MNHQDEVIVGQGHLSFGFALCSGRRPLHHGATLALGRPPLSQQGPPPLVSLGRGPGRPTAKLVRIRPEALFHLKMAWGCTQPKHRPFSGAESKCFWR